MLEVLDWGVASGSWFGYGHWSLIQPMLKILILKVRRTSMSLESWFWALEDTGDSWIGFGIWALVFDIPIILFMALYLDFEDVKNIHVLSVLIWGFRGHWRFLTGVGILILIWIWSLVFDIPMIQILALNLDFATSMSFNSCLGLLRMLEVPD